LQAKNPAARDSPRALDETVVIAPGAAASLRPALVAEAPANDLLWLATRQLEPVIVALIALGAAAFLEASLPDGRNTRIFIVAILVLAFLWSSAERLRATRSFEGASRLTRALAVVACAMAFARNLHSDWPWLWILALIAVYPIPMRPSAMVASILLGFFCEEAMSIALHGVDVPRSIARAAAFACVAALSYAFRLVLERKSREKGGIDSREQRAEIIAAYSDVVLLFADREYRLVHINRVAGRILGYPPGRLREIWNIDLVHPDDQDSFKRERERLLSAPGSSSTMPIRIRNVDGQWIWFEVRITNLLEHPAIRGFFASATDITARIEAEAKLKSERALMRTVIDSLPMSVYTKARDGRFLLSNRANLGRLGLPPDDDPIGKRSAEVARIAQTQIIDRDDRLVLDHGETLIDRQYRLLEADGSTRWYKATKLPLYDSAQRIEGLLGIVQDITEAKAAEVALREQATHDALTGLFNRRYLIEQLAAILGRSEPSPLALMFCDLDFFKGINDRYGHEIGDRFLTALGARLLPFGQSSGHILARFGGDEFVLLAPSADASAALALARRVLAALQAPIDVENLRLDVEASIGIVMLRKDHRKPEEMIRDADSAMYQAKGQLAERIAVFDDRLRSRTSRHNGLVAALKDPANGDALALCYQPKVNLHTGRVSGFEALLRWNTREYGAVDPAEFIPLAEESGQIVRLGHWALEEACGQLRKWQIHYPHLDHLTIAVNVSMRQLLDDQFVEDVVHILEKSQIYPAALELELTESAAMQNPDRTVGILQSLKSRGLRLALDDFGTGYSALAYLRRLPIDVLKIDRTFVHGLTRGGGDAEIVRLVIALARTLGIEAVAEGIESKESADHLARLGCDIGQGFHFSRPLAADDAEELLKSDKHYVVSSA